ncbi:Hypothetical protein PHPALM_38101 [Phytophthora palmivora]|uniref:Uncharacterized protein n=1 Tax=Phytophthora palmivora TaxID=4796 RepID=A0A2P4WVS2_9STRA|nr:Hypothetical protein PHPALM_38101 [Phytophthora palmivora]
MAWGWRRRYNDYEDEDREDEKPDEGEIFGNGKWPFGGEGQPRDIPVPFGAVVQQISEMLSRADNNAGEYSFGGQASTLPAAPGLDVNGVGLIPLPLTEEHALSWWVKCDKSPFGRKLDTMTDENVRKSWQLAPNQGIEKLSDTIATSRFIGMPRTATATVAPPKSTELKLNFLNPGRETFSALWANHGNSTFEGYLGNEGAKRNTTYSRYALVAWPVASGVENSFKYINVNATVGVGVAQLVLLNAAVEKAAQLLEKGLWTARVNYRCTSQNYAVVTIKKRLDRKELIETVMPMTDAIICCRSEWLTSQIRLLDVPFSCPCGDCNASFDMNVGTCGTFVTISKTREGYNEAQEQIIPKS